jgi:hypothetical protein
MRKPRLNTAQAKGGQTMNMLGRREINAPEKKPYKSANTIKPACEFTPNQPKIKTPLQNENGMIMLYGPILSETKLGNIRPKMDAAFTIGSCRNVRINIIFTGYP